MAAITIFTSTYNRAKCITRLYRSLLEQTYKDFEWIVIDDGSTDYTSALFEKYKEEKFINIKYFRVPNGGKHRAINKGIELAKGELFFIVDSDDYLLPNALEEIISCENNIPKNSGIAGMAYLKGHSANKSIGKTFKGNVRDLIIFDREKNNITGDKAEIFYTKILKKYRFPVFKNENFLSEAVLWNIMAFDGFKLRYVNKIIYICQYLEDGLTKNIEQKYRDNPKGFLLYLNQLLEINKKNIINRIKYVSYYQYIFKDIYDDRKICRDLNVTILFLKLSVVIRKIFKR